LRIDAANLPKGRRKIEGFPNDLAELRGEWITLDERQEKSLSDIRQRIRTVEISG
jgi:hypothetical protein